MPVELLAAIRFPDIDPVIFQIGPVAVRWYGLAYVVGVVLAIVLMRRLIKTGHLRITTDQLSSLINWVVPGVLIGGRLGWWFFYHRADPNVEEPWWEFLAAWHGGMSFHGGFVGVLLAIVLWSRFHRAPLLNVLDISAVATPLGLFFGRIANFINAELVGRPTDVPWAVHFPVKRMESGVVILDPVARHPSQLYEAFLEGPLLLAILYLTLWYVRPRDGRLAAMFLMGYGVFRFAVEFTREPDSQLGFIAFGWLTMGQLLSLVLVVAGVVFFLLAPKGDQRVGLGEAG